MKIAETSGSYMIAKPRTVLAALEVAGLCRPVESEQLVSLVWPPRDTGRKRQAVLGGAATTS